MNQQLINFLEEHESAPSACILARTFYYGGISDQEAYAIYERSEGTNDTERNELISKMSAEQLNRFYETVLMICLEKIQDFESDE